MSGTGIHLTANTTATAVSPQAAAATASDALNFSGLSQLRSDADAHDPKTILAVAKQFEAVLLQEMLSAMSATSFGSDLTGKNSGPLMKSLFNQQIAQTVSQGQGIGIAQTLAKEIATRYHLHWDQQNGVQGQDKPLSMPARNAALSAPVMLSESWAKPSQSLLEQAKSFVQSILPAVREAAQKLGVAPTAIIAQAALETGWGSHVAGNNLFGIKGGGGWLGASVHSLTHEFENGVNEVENAAFRAYQSVGQSVQNYAQLLMHNPRYRQALGQGNNIAGFAEALQQGGYATDPHYASKLVAVADSPLMQAVMGDLADENAAG
ncbi:flagellar assembly peptidoglycan hydrolase FlgJ [Acidithiobacillus montserratensis]|uniref:Flagellar assembly peptidoglycan hydrolase FlgJ n=1 Tax=Acidithiobacillus montserratensis TaxID=2729135 RepID=A0ACD5HLC9_9PROT|nr:flagellar assembly peptidoglycan hydrolase FlgJ [Acidithiobacillus montserratensis]MBN2680515.1 flagellar assembly peptidoglycan hydrolase FlgJ [Acidithiobacillaceae bacterium]MBU2747065.1 flagellar assembly peptidoglycan hydrolase FlgJ [Acidithiobacillus montserratensis]